MINKAQRRLIDRLVNNRNPGKSKTWYLKIVDGKVYMMLFSLDHIYNASRIASLYPDAFHCEIEPRIMGKLSLLDAAKARSLIV